MEGSQNDPHGFQEQISEGKTEDALVFSSENKAEQKDQLSTLLSSSRELLREKNFKNYQQAAELLEQALVKVREAANEIVEAEVCGELAKVLLSLNDYEKSLSYGQKCLSLSKEAGRKDLEALACSCVGSAYSKLGDLRRGLEFHMKSLDASSTTEDN